MSYVARTEFGSLRRVTQDGEKVGLLECPGCGQWGQLDDDMLHGVVSVDHTSEPGCTYHETHNFAEAIEGAGGWVVV